MSEYNKMPDNAIDITGDYEQIKGMFIFHTEIENRNPYYNEKMKSAGNFSMKIMWVCKDRGLGYGIADDWKERKIKVFKFGSEEKWRNFVDMISKQFY